MSIRHHLIALQKETFNALRQEILDQRRFEENRITVYRKRYLQEVKKYQKISSKKELFLELEKAKIIFCGDFHTLSRAQYTAVKILEHLAQKGKKVKLALEMIPRIYEGLANDFIQGRCDEQTFLDLIHYEKIWGFPWVHYRPIFLLAKKYGFSIVGVNTSDAGFQPLHIRDRCAAKAIYSTLQEDPNQVVFCLYGDLHLAQSHIPQKCKDLFVSNRKKTPSMVTVFQNSDEIYWKLVEKDMIDDVDVVKIKKDQYCVLSSTPWVKWQSYQSWMEDHISIMDSMEDQEWDVHYSPDYFHVVLEYAQKIQKFLKLKPTKGESIQVYSSLDTELTENINKYIIEARKRVNPIMQDMIDIEMIENRCLFLPEIPLIYIQDISPNKIAQKASQWVAQQLSYDFTIYDASFSLQEHFYRVAMIECVAFFGAKLINPTKKTSHVRDYETFLKRIKHEKLSDLEKTKKKVAQCVLAHQKKMKDAFEEQATFTFMPILQKLENQVFFLSARAIGRMTGEYLYLSVMDNSISIPMIKEVYRSFSKEASAFQSWLKIMENFQGQKKMTQKSKDELF